LDGRKVIWSVKNPVPLIPEASVPATVKEDHGNWKTAVEWKK